MFKERDGKVIADIQQIEKAANKIGLVVKNVDVTNRELSHILTVNLHPTGHFAQFDAEKMKKFQQVLSRDRNVDSIVMDTYNGHLELKMGKEIEKAGHVTNQSISGSKQVISLESSEDPWLNQEQVREMCIACAEKMAKKGLTQIRRSVVVSNMSIQSDDQAAEELVEAAKLLTADASRSFSKAIGSAEKVLKFAQKGDFKAVKRGVADVYRDINDIDAAVNTSRDFYLDFEEPINLTVYVTNKLLEMFLTKENIVSACEFLVKDLKEKESEVKSRKLSSIRVAEGNKEAEDYARDLKKRIAQVFPDSHLRVEFHTNLGDSIFIGFALGKDSSEWTNGIIHNDALHHQIWIEGVGVGSKWGGVMPEMVRSSLSVGGTMITPGGGMNGKSVKIGFRSKKGTPDKVADSIVTYFKRMKSVAKANPDLLFNTDAAKRVGGTMKITPEDYKLLEDAILGVVRKAGPKELGEYREKLMSNNRIKNVDESYRWGLLNASRLNTNDLYKYMNDNQIDTALRAIMKKNRLASRCAGTFDHVTKSLR